MRPRFSLKIRGKNMIVGRMLLLETISVALALNADTFAVSAAGGCTRAKVAPARKFCAAAVFAACQSSFALAGWAAGETAYSAVEGFVRIAAFALLFAVGAKMCADAFAGESGEHAANFLSPLKIKTLLALGAATSIDALAVGVSFAFTQTPILPACAAIAAATFAVAALGMELGAFAAKFSRRIPLLGGVVLIAIAFAVALK